METHKLFDDKSDIYARARPRYPAELYEWLVQACPERHAVWDVGCGNGQAAIDLINHFETVQATDVSPSQIENAPDREGITFSVQSAEKTDFADDSFDAVCVAQALHWFDYGQFWPEVQRVLKPGGLFAAWGYNWPHVDPVIDAILDQEFSPVIRPYWARNNKLLWDGYRDVPFPLELLHTPEIELTMEWSVEEFFAYLHSWSATRRCMEANGDGFFESSFQRINEVWGNEAKQPVSMDLVFIAGRNKA